MKDSININWLGNMAFEAVMDGHTITLDASSNVGGENRGPRPKPLMLLALAGCTGMDVISILKKMRVSVDKMNVSVEGELTEEHPKHFYSMHIIYTLYGKQLNREKIKKAVDLSQERYCGVSYTYRKAMKLTSEIILIEE